MTHNQYRMQRRLKSVKEPWYDPECIALSKHYSKSVYWITLWAFWWKAKNATYKTGWTFDPKYWDQYVPWPSVAILQGDILILNIWNDGHTCVGHNQVSDGYYVIEQNRNNTKTGTGQDAINIGFYSFENIKNIYRKK
jgi:hypothetical protein